MIEAALALGRYLFLALLSLFLWQLYRLLARDLQAAQRAPRQRREPRLIAVSGSGMAAPGRVYPIDGELTIGRLPDNTIVIDDGFCSARHARVDLRDGQVVVEDLGSTNGTLVDGQALVPHEPRRLADQARITLGATVLRFER